MIVSKSWNFLLKSYAAVAVILSFFDAEAGYEKSLNFFSYGPKLTYLQMFTFPKNLPLAHGLPDNFKST